MLLVMYLQNTGVNSQAGHAHTVLLRVKGGFCIESVNI